MPCRCFSIWIETAWVAVEKAEKNGKPNGDWSTLGCSRERPCTKICLMSSIAKKSKFHCPESHNGSAHKTDRSNCGSLCSPFLLASEIPPKSLKPETCHRQTVEFGHHIDEGRSAEETEDKASLSFERRETYCSPPPPSFFFSLSYSSSSSKSNGGNEKNERRNHPARPLQTEMSNNDETPLKTSSSSESGSDSSPREYYPGERYNWSNKMRPKIDHEDPFMRSLFAKDGNHQLQSIKSFATKTSADGGYASPNPKQHTRGESSTNTTELKRTAVQKGLPYNVVSCQQHYAASCDPGCPTQTSPDYYDHPDYSRHPSHRMRYSPIPSHPRYHPSPEGAAAVEDLYRNGYSHPYYDHTPKDQYSYFYQCSDAHSHQAHPDSFGTDGGYYYSPIPHSQIDGAFHNSSRPFFSTQEASPDHVSYLGSVSAISHGENPFSDTNCQQTVSPPNQKPSQRPGTKISFRVGSGIRDSKTSVINIPKNGGAWYDRLSELMEYKQIFGDCNVPQKYPENARLGIWVNKQR